MDEQIKKLVSQQLRKPEGEMGLEVAERMNKGNKEMNLRTIEKLNVSPGDNILEIGMGNGLFVGNILSIDKSVRYTGCDYSELMIEEAKKINSQFVKNGQAKFFLTDAENLPFDDKTFNKLFTVNTIYFWNDPDEILSEFHRVLKTGGLLIITLRPKWNMENNPYAKYGFTLNSSDEVSKLLSQNGFTVTLVEEKDDGEYEFEGETVKLASVVLCSVKE